MSEDINYKKLSADSHKIANRLDWNSMKYFLVLTRHRKVTEAARVSGVVHATIYRHIRHLEEVLDVTLFRKRDNSNELTSEGAELLEAAEAVHESILGAIIKRQARLNTKDAIVRITATRTLADAWLSKFIEEYRQSHADTSFEIIATSRNLDLLKEEADIALRLKRPQHDDLIIKRMVNLNYGLYVSAKRPPDGEPYPVILYPHETAIPEALWLERYAEGQIPVIRTNSLTAQLTAAVDGIGAALLPKYLGGMNPDLIEIPTAEPPPQREIWLLTTKKKRSQLHIRSIINELTAAFHRDRGLFEGYT